MDNLKVVSNLKVINNLIPLIRAREFTSKKGSTRLFRNVSILLFFLIFFSIIFFNFIDKNVTGEVTKLDQKDVNEEKSESLLVIFLSSIAFILVLVVIVGITMLLKVK